QMARQATQSNPTMTFTLVATLIVVLAAVLGAYHREVGRELARLGQTMEGVQAQADAGVEVAIPQEPQATGPASGKEARLLWAKVAKGDTFAEVALAKLYLTGDGVTKSCVQARLLLTAAADKGNADAQQKLAQLNRKGCS